MSSSDSSENEHYTDDEISTPREYDFFNGAFNTPFFKGLTTGTARNPPQKPYQKSDDGPTKQVNINAEGSVSLFNNTYIHNHGPGLHSEEETPISQTNHNVPPRSKIKESVLESQEIIEDEHMYKVGDLIGSKWKRLAKFLPSDPKFTESDLEVIKFDKERDGLVEIVVCVLNKWVERNGENATVGALAKTLQKIDCSDIANELDLVKTD